MTRTITKNLSGDWNIDTRKTLLGEEGDFRIVEKTNEEIILRERKYGNVNPKIIIRAYSPGTIILEHFNDKIIKADSKRVITEITPDEYYHKTPPTSELNKKYLEILWEN